MDTDIYVLLTFYTFLSSRIVHNKKVTQLSDAWLPLAFDNRRKSYIANPQPFLVGKMKWDIERKINRWAIPFSLVGKKIRGIRGNFKLYRL